MFQRVRFLSVVAVFFLGACVGLGRNRDDELSMRSTKFYSDEIESEDKGYRYAQEEEIVHRVRPVVDPRDIRAGQDDPNFFLNQLQSKVAGIPLEGFALLWEDARVYRSVSMDEESFLGRLSYRPDYWRSGGGRVIPVRILQDHGPVVEIETISTEQAVRHCEGNSRGAIASISVKFFVRRSELAPVIYRETQRNYPDGSVAYIPPGVAVRPTVDGLKARLLGGSLEVSGPEGVENVSLSYQRAGFLAERLEPEHIAGHLHQHISLSVDGNPVELRMLPGDAGRPRWVRPMREGEGSQIFIADRCVALIMVSDDPNPMNNTDDEDLALSSIRRLPPEDHYLYEVKKDVPVWWPGRYEAGVTRQRTFFNSEPEIVAGLLCFPLMGVVSICHDPQDVTMRDRTGVEDLSSEQEEDSGDWIDDAPALIEKKPGYWERE